MLEIYFTAPKSLERLRTSISAPYIDGFAGILKENGYSKGSAIRYLRVASHLGWFLVSRGESLINVDATTAEAFRYHLPDCRCPNSNGGKINHHTFYGVKRFYQYLQQVGVVPRERTSNDELTEPTFVTSFRHWLHSHRGLAQPTVKLYCRGAKELLSVLGDDPGQWNVKQIRAFFLDHAESCGAATVEKLVTSVRAFLRYLISEGHCSVDLDQAIPSLAHWRLASLPRCLTSEELERLLAACEGTSPNRLRDRAIILLLVRLGLRSGDVAAMCVDDIEWSSATLRVSGKGRYEVRLPLPQDVGDALLCYLECRPVNARTNKLFVRNRAPCRPFVSGDGVSSVVKRALGRAQVNSPAKGAHILRHTAATEMLRQGMPLEQIGTILRHRNIDTTAYYAKVDVGLLEQITQPWPEVLR
jgi:site-specific recombinase XerD